MKLKGKKRIVSHPHMGNISIPVRAMLESMGATLLLPPENNKKALSLGVRYSPETMCLPYKMNLGNYVQALEMGANVLLMFRAPGSCRLGHYTTMAESTLKELGYDFEMVVFDFYRGKLLEVTNKFSIACNGASIPGTFHGIALLLSKFRALDALERKLFYYRPREIKKGCAEAVYKQGRSGIDRAGSLSGIKRALNHALEKFENIKTDSTGHILKILLTGEFFLLLDPFSNFDIEKELGYLGVEIHREVMLSEWINVKLLPSWLHSSECHTARALRFSGDYMKRIVGGDCTESIADTVSAAQNKFDGVIHLAPFNCNPETVTQSVLPHISRKENIPVISLMIDEMTGKAGFLTRLEAFVDLVRRHSRAKSLNFPAKTARTAFLHLPDSSPEILLNSL